MTVPWRPAPLAPVDIATQPQPFFTGVRYTKTMYNYHADGSPSDAPFPAGVMQFEIGTLVFPWIIAGGAATIDIPATATASIADGTAWRLTWTAKGGTLEVLASGTTERLVPCCP